MNHRIHSWANNSYTCSIVPDLCYAANILHVQYLNMGNWIGQGWMILVLYWFPLFLLKMVRLERNM
jgi:hypothetical protein